MRRKAAGFLRDGVLGGAPAFVRQESAIAGTPVALKQWLTGLVVGRQRSPMTAKARLFEQQSQQIHTAYNTKSLAI